MVSGKRVVLVSALVVGVMVAFSVYTVLTRQKGAAQVFVGQMKTEPRCNILSATDVGVRRQGLLALMELHPDWGVDGKKVAVEAGRIDVAGAGELPSTGGAHLGYVELGWPMQGQDPTHMKGMRILCRDGLAVQGVPFDVTQGGEALRSQGTILLPPVKRAFPAEAKAVDLSGEGAQSVGWRRRCYPDGPASTRCDVDAFNLEVASLFVPVMSFFSEALEPPQGPTHKDDRRLLGGRVEGGQVYLSFEVASEEAQLSGACPAGEAYVGRGAREVEGCEVRRLNQSARCECGPWPVKVAESSGIVACRPVGSPADAEAEGEGFEADPQDPLAALCRSIPIPPLLDEP